jgi:hypothetical protein
LKSSTTRLMPSPYVIATTCAPDPCRSIAEAAQSRCLE